MKTLAPSNMGNVSNPHPPRSVPLCLWCHHKSCKPGCRLGQFRNYPHVPHKFPFCLYCIIKFPTGINKVSSISIYLCPPVAVGLGHMAIDMELPRTPAQRCKALSGSPNLKTLWGTGFWSPSSELHFHALIFINLGAFTAGSSTNDLDRATTT